MCPVDNPDQIVTQECFDQHVLPIAGTNNDKYYIPEDTLKTAMLEYEVTLPMGVTCSQCVIQWTWKSGIEFIFYFMDYIQGKYFAK